MKIFEITQRYRQTEPLCQNEPSDKKTKTLNMGTCDPKAGGGGEGVGAASCPVGGSDNLCGRNRTSSGAAGEVASLPCVEDAREREVKVKNVRVRTRMR